MSAIWSAECRKAIENIKAKSPEPLAYEPHPVKQAKEK